MSKSTESKQPAFIAYHVPDRENAYWTKIGAAWPHKDGKGFSLELELMPTASARITLRAYEPDAQQDEQPNG